jgi:hypothetical protein
MAESFNLHDGIKKCETDNCSGIATAVVALRLRRGVILTMLMCDRCVKKEGSERVIQVQSLQRG